MTDNDEVSQQTVKEQHNTPPSLLSRISGPHTQAAPIKMPVVAAATHPPYVSCWSYMSPVYAVKRRGLYHLSQTATSEKKGGDLLRCFGSSKAYQERPQAYQKVSRSAGPRDGGVPGDCFGRKSRIDSGRAYLVFCFVRALSNPIKLDCVPYSILAGVADLINSLAKPLYLVDTTTDTGPSVRI